MNKFKQGETKSDASLLFNIGPVSWKRKVGKGACVYKMIQWM